MKANEIIEKLFNENGINETIEVMAEKRKQIARDEFASKAESAKQLADLVMNLGEQWLAFETANIQKVLQKDTQAGKENRNGNS